VLSVRLTPNGRDVYVTYDRPQPRPEEPSAPSRERWRFDRWSSEPAGGKPSPVVRLAATATDEYTQLLAISADGQLAVLSERGALTVRRAPRYESERLASEWASAAAVSRDGTRIAIGYLDGRLQLWDARTSRPIAAAGP
jgi:WD40 repeat protein